MLDPGPGTTSEASYLEPRITVTTQDSSPGIQLSWMANPSSEEPYALVWACTDLWEAWVGNHPGPPGPVRLCKLHFVALRGSTCYAKTWLTNAATIVGLMAHRCRDQ
jgi:hypothetical protein